MAVQKELTLNPSTKWSQSNIIPVLINNKNNPKVITVMGKVNNTKIGFTKKLSKPKTIANVRAVVNSSTTTPFITFAIINTKMAVISILNSSFIVSILRFPVSQKPCRFLKKQFRIFGMKPMTNVWNCSKFKIRKMYFYFE